MKLIRFEAGFILLLWCMAANAQRGEYNIWYFGDRSGLDFNTVPPTVLSNTPMQTYESGSGICDKNGHLLFYTNGDTVTTATTRTC